MNFRSRLFDLIIVSSLLLAILIAGSVIAGSVPSTHHGGLITVTRPRLPALPRPSPIAPRPSHMPAAVTLAATAPPSMTVGNSDGNLSVFPGQAVTYTLGFTNTATQGGAVATGVTLVDTLPANTTFASCQVNTGYAGTCVQSSNTVTITINGTIAPGAGDNVSIAAHVASSATGTITNAVTLAANNAAGRPQPAVSATHSDDVVVLATPAGAGTQYSVNATLGASILPGTTDIGNHCDDCAGAISVPFAVQLYGQTYAANTPLTVTSNGQLDLSGAPDTTYDSTGGLRDTNAADAIFAYWGDLTTFGDGNGIFTGRPDANTFVVEWRAATVATSESVNFEIVFHRSTPARIDLIYGTLDALRGGAQTVGLQRGDGATFTQDERHARDTLGPGLALALTDSGAPGSVPTILATQTPGPTATPFSLSPPTGIGTQYRIVSSQGATVQQGPAVTDSGNHCDDCATGLSLPQGFAFSFYGQPVTALSATSNGQLSFGGPPDAGFAEAALPDPRAHDAIFVHWGDLTTAGTQPDGTPCGIFTSVSGSAPTRVFNVEWRAMYIDNGGPVDIEARLFEGSSRFDLVYNQIDEQGGGATVGVQQGTGTANYTQYESNIAGTLEPAIDLTFTYTGDPGSAPTVLPTYVAIATPTDVPAVTATLIPVTASPVPVTPTGQGARARSTPSSRGSTCRSFRGPRTRASTARNAPKGSPCPSPSCSTAGATARSSSAPTGSSPLPRRTRRSLRARCPTRRRATPSWPTGATCAPTGCCRTAAARASTPRAPTRTPSWCSGTWPTRTRARPSTSRSCSTVGRRPST